MARLITPTPHSALALEPSDERLAMEITLERGELEAMLLHPLVHALLEHGTDGAVVIDIATRQIIAINRRAKKMLGYTESDVVGQGCKATYNSPDCGRRCLINETLETGGCGPVAEVLYRGQGKKGHVHTHTRVLLIRDPEGNPLAGIELLRDVTPVRTMERVLNERRALHGIVGEADVMQGLYDLVEQVAPYELPVLITGESGVGKERFSDAVQYLSDRADEPYVKVNCAALNASLIESELFGHRRGAFTGATQDRRGSFEEANGGTILLDEVGELPIELQPKLLRVLQQGEIQRVGEDRPRHVDVRVIAATNQEIENAVAEGRFREDLYYRLAGVRLHVPPLRDRLDDIPALVDHFIDSFTKESHRRGRPKARPEVAQTTVDHLMSRDWRGNIRELQNVLRLGFIRVPDGEVIQPEHLQMPGAPAAPARQVRTLDLGQIEAQAIDEAVQRADGNMSAAAELLGINRSTLWRKLKKLER